MTFLKYGSAAALVLCLMAPILVFTQHISFHGYLILFNIATLLWFFTAPFWMLQKSKDA